MKKIILNGIVIFLFWYLLTSFVQTTIFFDEWSKDARILFVFIFASCSIVNLIVCFNLLEDEE